MLAPSSSLCTVDIYEDKTPANILTSFSPGKTGKLVAAQMTNRQTLATRNFRDTLATRLMLGSLEAPVKARQSLLTIRGFNGIVKPWEISNGISCEFKATSLQFHVEFGPQPDLPSAQDRARAARP